MRLAVTVLGLAVLCAAPTARADQVHLIDGAVLDGRAERQGDKVVIEVIEGTITVDASTVVRIVPGKSRVERIEEQLQKLSKTDVRGLLALADQCRDQGLTARERQVLRRILEVSPDHSEARRRLGYVKDPAAGWLTEAEAKQRAGFVRYEGHWVTPEERLALERIALDARRAALEREQAALEVERERLRVEGVRAENERAAEAAERAAAEARNQPAVLTPWFYGPIRPSVRPSAGPIPTHPGSSFGNVPPTWSIPGTRDPRSYF